jgi:hypothetical protein
MRRRGLVLSVAATGVMVLGAAGCGAARQVWTAMRSTSGFKASSDPRVFYEPGGERLLPAVVAAVPGATQRVEAALGRPFTVPVRIYVCATLGSYMKFTGHDRSGGDTTFRKKIFISPKPENTPERMPAVVAHEMTHLHVAQDLSLWRSSRLPFWFNEGLAAFVSGGGGAEGVTDAEAARAIVAGQRLAPDYSPGRTASSFGLTPHMFYRQGAMFFGYLKGRDPEAFRRFLSGVEDGKTLERAFEDAYATPIDVRWNAFVAQLAAQ